MRQSAAIVAQKEVGLGQIVRSSLFGKFLYLGSPELDDHLWSDIPKNPGLISKLLSAHEKLPCKEFRYNSEEPSSSGLPVLRGDHCFVGS